MRYDLISGDRALTVEATPPDEQLTTTMVASALGGEDGAEEERVLERELRLRALSPNCLQVLDGTMVSELFVARHAGGTWVWCDGCARQVRDATSQPSSTASEGAGGEVTPPMPAVVQELCVVVGDRVEKGSRLVVLSAMKMETTLVAPRSGEVIAVSVEVGDKVAPGDILVEIQPESGSEAHGGEDG